MPTVTEDFSAPDWTAWRALVEHGLKGADFEERLVARTEDGIRIAPLFTRDDALPEAALPGQSPWLRGSRSARHGWEIRSWCREADPAVANRQILADLAGGAGSILLDGDAVAAEGLPLVLDSVMLDIAPVYLRLADDRLWEGGALPTGVRPVLDPIEAWASGSVDDVDTAIARLFPDGEARQPECHIGVDGRTFDDAGASDGEEIGLTMAAVIGLARVLDMHGMMPALTLGRIILGVTTNVDFFAGIAKIRALRRLWGRVAQVLDVDGPPSIHAVTSARMQSRYEPWTNLLRNTLACAAAGLGGADAVTVLPHDHASGCTDVRSARIARNVQNVLQHESRLDAVADPLGGSWYIEQLTEQLAQAGWQVVQRVEAAGGFGTACSTGLIETILAERRAERTRHIRTRQTVIVGVNRFANDGDRTVPPRPRMLDRRLPRVRDAEPFEALRDRVLGGEVGPVLVVPWGPTEQHAAAVGLAADLFAAAGIRTVVRGNSDSNPPSARLAVIVGAASAPAAATAALARELSATGVGEVHLLGQPDERRGEPLPAGVARSFADGEDAVGYLGDVVERLT